jgi:hypothetical protein
MYTGLGRRPFKACFRSPSFSFVLIEKWRGEVVVASLGELEMNEGQIFW